MYNSKLASTITGCISISAFASLIGIPIGITSSAIGLKICAITAGIKKYKSTIKKIKKKHDIIVFLAKSKLNSTVVDATRLTGSVKPGDIWQLNIWIWILQLHQN